MANSYDAIEFKYDIQMAHGTMKAGNNEGLQNKRRSTRKTAQKKKFIESGTSERDSDSDGHGEKEMYGKERKRKRGRPRIIVQQKKFKNFETRVTSSSDSDKNSEVDDYDDNMFLDEEDRIRLESMTEKEREAEIFKRIEQREVLRARHAIQKKILAKKEDRDGKRKDSNKPKKKNEKEKDPGERKASNSDDDSFAHDTAKDRSPVLLPPKTEKSDVDNVVTFDEYQHPSEVQRKQKQKSAMADLVNRRKEKREAEQKKKAFSHGTTALDVDEVFGNNGSEDQGKSSSSSSDSASHSSSANFSLRTRSPSPVKKQEMTRLSDIERLRMSRFKLSKLVHAPFFAQLVAGCFVRIGIGKSMDGKSVYRVAQVSDVVETAKVYQLEMTRTNKGLKLKHGKDERVYRLEFVSNSPFTPFEFTKWRDSMGIANLPLPTMDHVEKKEMEIKNAMNYKYTEQDIEVMVKEKSRFQNAPFNYAIEKGKLIKLKQEAEQYGRLDEAEYLQQRIEALDNKAADLDRRRSQSIRGISWINERNRQAMKNAVFSGTLRFEKPNEDDPFTRKNARMKPVSGKDRTSGLDSISNDTLVDSQTSLTTLGDYEQLDTSIDDVDKIIKKDEFNTTFNKPVHDLFGAHNFELFLKIDLPVTNNLLLDATSSHSNLSSGSPQVARFSTSRSLNLDEYKRR